MKKTMFLFLAIMSTIALLAACSNSATDNKSTATDKPATNATETTGPVTIDF